jgi:uncharacterized protein
MSPAETPFFFARERTRLFGLLHEPADAPSRLGFVLSHPFGEEKLWSHRVFVSLARALALRGHPVLRFDFTGAGDSDGSSADTSLSSHLADLGAAVETLASRRPDVQRVGLIGLRFGASVAARLMESTASGAAPAALRGAPLVLVDPVLDGAAYLQEVLRGNLSAQLATHGKVLETREAMGDRIRAGGVVNVDGYEIGRSLFESISIPDLVSIGPKTHEGPVLVVSLVTPGKPPKPHASLDALASAYPRGERLEAHEHQFWREIKQFYGRASDLQTKMLEWLGAHRG